MPKSLDPDQVHILSGPGPGLEVIKLKFILKVKIKYNDWLLADTLRFILSLRLLKFYNLEA